MLRNSLITNAPTAAFRVRAPTQSKGEPKRKTCQGRNRARPPSTSLASCRLRRLLCQRHPALHEDLPFTKDVLFQRGRHPHADVHLPVWPQTEEEEVDEARPQTVLLQAVPNKRLRLPGRLLQGESVQVEYPLRPRARGDAAAHGRELIVVALVVPPSRQRHLVRSQAEDVEEWQVVEQHNIWPHEDQVRERPAGIHRHPKHTPDRLQLAEAVEHQRGIPRRWALAVASPLRSQLRFEGGLVVAAEGVRCQQRGLAVVDPRACRAVPDALHAVRQVPRVHIRAVREPGPVEQASEVACVRGVRTQPHAAGEAPVAQRELQLAPRVQQRRRRRRGALP
mmetsp:Transcript_13242/g.33061  ORF Transcript_13242/g.33061 Transcript_13242/m.33061 type:complete len:337 (-) Transcript_13242:418-1428(-)